MLDLLAAAWWPALLAAIVSVGVTVAIEQLGGKLGGLIGTLPTTIVPASLGLWTGEASAMTEAMAAVPPAMMLNAGFLWCWRIFPQKIPEGWGLGARLTTMSLLSLSVWLVGALGVVLALRAWLSAELPALGAGLIGLAGLVGIGLWATARPRPAPRGSRKVGPGVLVMRGLFAGAAIGTAVVIGRTGGDLAGGVASVFPAIFLTTMVALWLSQGEAVPAGAVGPMMLGSAAVGTYALLAAWTFPAVGPLLGGAVAWALAALSTTLPAWLWIRRQDRRAQVRAQTESIPPSTT
ncbi:MAG: hypothetical protein EA397_10990 [Deltaproteobacteria bacterium]|nr:MAG: hypothetical protein EA397_10990 [Deltaproteobacteria bacterium]